MPEYEDDLASAGETISAPLRGIEFGHAQSNHARWPFACLGCILRVKIALFLHPVCASKILFSRKYQHFFFFF